MICYLLLNDFQAASSNGTLGKKQAPAAPIKLDSRPAKKHGVIAFNIIMPNNWNKSIFCNFYIFQLFLSVSQLLLRSRVPCVLLRLLPQRWWNILSLTLSTLFPATTLKTSLNNIKLQTQNLCRRGRGGLPVHLLLCIMQSDYFIIIILYSKDGMRLLTGEMGKVLSRSWTHMMRQCRS